jgi:hypothetical protein
VLQGHTTNGVYNGCNNKGGPSIDIKLVISCSTCVLFYMLHVTISRCNSHACTARTRVLQSSGCKLLPSLM